jgi:hypothetical protein
MTPPARDQGGGPAASTAWHDPIDRAR